MTDTTQNANGTAFYRKHGNTYFIRLVGDISYYAMSCSLDAFLDALFQRQDFDEIVVDLTEANFIDSTNLGLLAKIANFIKQRFGKKTTLVSTNENINEVLDKIGFSDIFIISQERQPVETTQEQELVISAPRQEDLRKIILKSHVILCDVNEANRDMFGGVVKILKHQATDKI
jgi:anti-anti-sigma factor